MKKALFGVFTLVIFVLTFTLSSLSAKEIPLDKNLKIGKLENGLRYYIKENRFQKEKASLRLLIKVGSALELEHERGIAHFLEHLVFRGSENFQDWEMIKYLESIGAEFGPDTNAFTFFDRTCYMLEVPLKNIEDLDKALLFLSDIAMRAKLEDDKVDKERDIVLDELRRFLGPNMRVVDKHLKIILKDTSYEDRLPIGKEDIIKNCLPEIIRNFYKKWYQPQNMALIAVGDFDQTLVQKAIEKHFSDFKNETDILPEYVVEKNQETLFSIVHDPEISTSTIELILRENTHPTTTKKDIKDGIIFGIINDVLNERFHQLSAKSDSPFISAWSFSNSFITNFQMKELGVMLWEDKKLEGLENALLQVKKLNLGISSDEFLRTIKNRKEKIKKALNNLDKVENNGYISMYSDHFINGDVIFSKKALLQCKDKFLDDLKVDDVNKELSSFDVDEFFSNNFIVCITLPEDASITESEITDTLMKTKNMPIATEETFALDEKALIEPKLEKEGKISKIEKDENLNITEVVFENGLKVFLKPTDLKKDEIIIRSYALKGLANLDESILDSAKIAMNYFYDSGIAGIDQSSFSQILNSKNSSLNISLGLNTRFISANTTKDNFEDIVKLINRVFTSKNYQDDMFEKTIKIAKENQKYSNLDSTAIFYKKASSIFTSKSSLFTDANLDLVDLEISKNVIDTFFSNPEDFSFFIVGDFKVDEILPVLERNLGAISQGKVNQIELKDLKNIKFPDNSTEVVRAGTEDKSMCFLGFDLEQMDLHNEKEDTAMSLLKSIVKNRLLDALRIENGKTYSANCFYSFYLYPNLSNFNYFISFSGPGSDIFNINDLTINTMKELIEKGPTIDELNVAKEIERNAFKESKRYNSFEINTLLDAHMLAEELSYDYKESLRLNEDEMIDNLSIDEMKNFIKKIFSKDKLTSVIWLPEEK